MFVVGLDCYGTKENEERDGRKYSDERFHEDTLLAARAQTDAPQSEFEFYGKFMTDEDRSSLHGSREKVRMARRLWGLSGGVVRAGGAWLRAATLAGSSWLRGEFAFPASDDDAGDAIAENGDGRSPHIHELIDREEKK